MINNILKFLFLEKKSLRFFMKKIYFHENRYVGAHMFFLWGPV